MSQLDNLKAFDPFADASKGDEESGQEGVVHIRYTLQETIYAFSSDDRRH